MPATVNVVLSGIVSTCCIEFGHFPGTHYVTLNASDVNGLWVVPFDPGLGSHTLITTIPVMSRTADCIGGSEFEMLFIISVTCAFDEQGFLIVGVSATVNIYFDSPFVLTLNAGLFESTGAVRIDEAVGNFLTTEQCDAIQDSPDQYSGLLGYGGYATVSAA